jgi:hypothetical protein
VLVESSDLAKIFSFDLSIEIKGLLGSVERGDY